MDTNRKFTGVVNGKTYTDIEEYNKAFLDALGRNGGQDAVTAQIEFRAGDTDQEQSFDYCLPDFDLDELTGMTETDTPIIDDFIKQDLASERIIDILNQSDKMSTNARAELSSYVKDMIESIKADINDNNRSHTTLLKDMAVNERETNQILSKLDNLKKGKNKIQAQINIIEGADRVLRASLGFYSALYEDLNSRLRVDEDLNSRLRTDDPSARVSGRAVEKGSPGFILDHDQKEIARKLFKEILGI